MSLWRQPIRVAMGGNFVVHPDARSSPAGLSLLEAYMEGAQDLSLTDSANDASRILMERLGFRTLMPFSTGWARALRPSRYAVHALCSLANPVISTSLSFVTKPLCGFADALANGLSLNPFRPTESPLHAVELDAEALLTFFSDFSNGHAIVPQYDVHSLSCLLSFMQRMHPDTELRKLGLRDASDTIVGWYLYYVRPGAVGQVIQIGCERQFLREVLDHLFH